MWFRVYPEILNDPKIRRASRALKWDYAKTLGHWLGILCLASESPDRGKLLLSMDEPLSIDDIAQGLKLSTVIAQKFIEIALDSGLLDRENDVFFVPAWSSRQFNSDGSTDRVRKHRETVEKLSRNVSCNEVRNAPDTNTETEQKQNNTPTPLKGDALFAEEFERHFWPSYPTVGKVAKPKALLSFLKARKKESLVMIMTGLMAYKKIVERIPENDRDFIPKCAHATTWLNGERWNDELPECSQIIEEREQEEPRYTDVDNLFYRQVDGHTHNKDEEPGDCPICAREKK